MAISAVSSYFYFKNNSSQAAETDTAAAASAPVKTTSLEELNLDDLKTLNVLLLGYGGAGHQGGYLSDVIQVVSINFETGVVAMLSIPRDLWVKLPNNRQTKINQALTLGNDPNQPITSGAIAAKQMVKTVTGLDIDYFAAVDFVGFKRAIGVNLGGIEVDVPETLEDPWYPIDGEQLNPCGMTPDEIAELTEQYSGFELEKQFPCRYEHLYFEQGVNHMEGGAALKYVRSRHGSGAGDFSRSQRQHAVLMGIRDRIMEVEVWDDLPAFFAEVSDNVATDLDLEIVQYLAPALKQAGNFETKTVIISTDNILQAATSANGQAILIPKQGMDQWDQVHQFVQEQVGSEN